MKRAGEGRRVNAKNGIESLGRDKRKEKEREKDETS
jgi:hypothetical protein